MSAMGTLFYVLALSASPAPEWPKDPASGKPAELHKDSEHLEDEKSAPEALSSEPGIGPALLFY